jgi:hypothetical protein
VKSWLINDALRSYGRNARRQCGGWWAGAREGRTVDHQTVIAAFDRIVTPG